jgi:hypothetical protein
MVRYKVGALKGTGGTVKQKPRSASVETVLVDIPRSFGVRC